MEMDKKSFTVCGKCENYDQKNDKCKVTGESINPYDAFYSSGIGQKCPRPENN